MKSEDHNHFSRLIDGTGIDPYELETYELLHGLWSWHVVEDGYVGPYATVNKTKFPDLSKNAIGDGSEFLILEKDDFTMYCTIEVNSQNIRELIFMCRVVNMDRDYITIYSSITEMYKMLRDSDDR